MPLRSPPRRPAVATLFAGFLISASAAHGATQELWSDAIPGAATARPATNGKTSFPQRRVRLKADGLTGFARQPSGRASQPARTIDLPLPGGGSSRFTLVDSAVLPPGLAARYPGLRSMIGHDAEGRTARIDLDVAGAVHARVSDATGDWFVQPEAPAKRGPAARSRRTSAMHTVFRREDAPAGSALHETVPPPGSTAPNARHADGLAKTARGSARTGSGQPLRSFRIAMSATSDYVARMGGTVEDGLAGVMKVVNRLNAIYENDLGVHLQLADDNDRLIFANAATDPFRGLTGDAQYALRNGTVAAQTLGRDHYDVGHLLHAVTEGTAGLAGRIGNTCLTPDRTVVVMPGKPVSDKDFADGGADKAVGMTGSDNPFGDAFHVDYVAHELGHQFGGKHTFNIAGKDPKLDQRDPEGAVEPGSGSTIMGYAGLTSADLQTRSDDYFHGRSIEQIRAWLDSEGGACAATRVNPIPTPGLDTDDWSYVAVPARTPFALSGALRHTRPGTTPTYTFEQIDRGRAQTTPVLADVGNGPLFRSRRPQPEGLQTFPAMSVLLGKEPPGRGDALPTRDRTLNFRLTARDNLDHLAHVVSRDITVDVVDTGKPFEVVAPRANATIARGLARTVKWRVAGTDKAPLSCAKVDVRLSIDGGESWLDTDLLTEVDNKGSARFTIPRSVTPTMRGRLSVACSEASTPFFALSPGDFRIR